MSLWTTGILLVILLASPLPLQEHQHGGRDTQKVGTVAFATSCNATVQPTYNRAVALLHSFEFGRSIAAFKEVLSADPSCAMAEWGIGLSLWGNPFAPGIKSNAQVQAGFEAIQRGRAPGARTDRERGYIEAVAKLYEDGARVPQQARVVAYRDAMTALADRYPDDDEAAIFSALAIAMAADPADKSYVSQLKAGAILDRLFATHHDHPGLAHYIIHAYDFPPLADRALEAARRYAAIAPMAPHALHMPSHTFTRTGFWQESIDTNLQSAAAARSEGAIGEELHASDYQMYAYMQTAQDRAARRLLDTLPEMIRRYNPNVISGAAPPAAAYFAMAALPARYALERGAWSDAVALQPRITDFPYTEAMTHFARAVGAGHTRRADVIRGSLDALQRIHDRLAGVGEAYWAGQVDIQRRSAAAWLAVAEDRKSDAVADMRAAADREDATDKSAITPGPLAPAREMLGELLLETGTATAAFKEFEATLRQEPNRFRSVAGAARAAAAAGDRQAAASYYERLLAICARADRPGRPELIEARRANVRRSGSR
jgi:hypothetical protein